MAAMREIAVPAGQGDSGDADPELDGLLDTDDLDRLPTVFAKARLFVPVEPRLVEADRETGADKQSDMVLVTLRRPDGTTAVPAFTSVAALTSWRASARPVPVLGSALAAQAC
nr:SseB family protein [Micromonospora sp. DSM 115978]